MRLRFPLFGSLPLVAVACTSPGTPAGPIAGSWQVTRSVATQPANCRRLSAPPIEVEFAPGESAPISIVSGATLRDYDQAVTADAASFVTEDLAFPEDSFRSVVISHALHIAGDQLVGTGQAAGDGDDLGCHYDLILAGTRAGK